ncbi:MAG TPA: hypothetical protein VEJ63_07215, partial [Planctomycetota bacterium]|nr:hypothetical protein [Planctomycetota bacterium]
VASLDNWTGAGGMGDRDRDRGDGDRGRRGSNAWGRNELDWREDISIVVEHDKEGALKWTIDGSELGKVKVPERLSKFQLAFFGASGSHVWGGLKIVFKPDPEWAKEARAKK